MTTSGRAGASELVEELPQARGMAEAEDFGAYVTGHKMPPKKAPWWVGLPLLLVPMVGGFALVLREPAPGSGAGGRVVGAVLLLVAVALGAALFLQEKRHRRDMANAPTVYGYERGMVIVSTQGCDAHPWHAVLPFEYAMTRSIGSSGRNVSISLLDLRTLGGEKLLTFNGRGGHIDCLADLIAAYEVPRARARLERGESVTYGSFTLSADSVTVDGRRCSWQDARSMAVAHETPHLRALHVLIEERVTHGHTPS
ncbi:hypothetical protein [Streptomyces sp. NPDC001056]